jgi:hypothetical protein
MSKATYYRLRKSFSAKGSNMRKVLEKKNSRPGKMRRSKF